MDRLEKGLLCFGGLCHSLAHAYILGALYLGGMCVSSGWGAERGNPGSLLSLAACVSTIKEVCPYAYVCQRSYSLTGCNGSHSSRPGRPSWMMPCSVQRDSG